MATDRMTAWGVVDGMAVAPRLADLNDVDVRMSCNDEQRIVVRSGDEVDDRPTSVARLAAELDRYGLGYEVIIVALGRFDVAPGGQLSASFDGVGDVAIPAR
jgi:hypothetical protein